MAEVNSTRDVSRLVDQLRRSWMILSEVQLALEHDDSREQDRQNRFNYTLNMVLTQQDESLQELERLFRGDRFNV